MEMKFRIWFKDLILIKSLNFAIKLVIYPKKGYNKTRIYKGDELKWKFQEKNYYTLQI